MHKSRHACLQESALHWEENGGAVEKQRKAHMKEADNPPMLIMIDMAVKTVF